MAFGRCLVLWRIPRWPELSGRPGLILWIAVGLVGVATPSLRAQRKEPHRSAHVPKGYRLVWHDEFSGPKLDMKKWAYRELGKREHAVVTKEAVKLDGKGSLHLTTFEKNGTLYTGMIGTQGLFQQKYGYFEARIRFQRLQGHHGAFWLQSPTYGKVLNDPGRSGA